MFRPAKWSAVNEIGQVLMSKFPFRLARGFLSDYGVNCQGYPDEPEEDGMEYLHIYLSDADESTIFQIAGDLEIDIYGPKVSPKHPPDLWQSTEEFKLFISHISEHKDIALRLKESLKVHEINGFVAHEDINPALEWQTQLLRALSCMDALVAVHTERFSASPWAQQEIGIALGRGKKVISFKYGEDPTGFLARYQAIPRRNRKAEEIAKKINDLLIEDEETRSILKAAQEKRIPY